MRRSRPLALVAVTALGATAASLTGPGPAAALTPTTPAAAAAATAPAKVTDAGSAAPLAAADDEHPLIGSTPTSRLVSRTRARGRTVIAVRFAPGVRPAVATRTRSLSLSARLFSAAPRSTSDALGAATYTVPDGEVAAFTAALRARGDVRSVRVANLYAPQTVPNDPQYTTEQRGYLQRIGVPTAWSWARGASDVTIAVIDSGVDVSHPDLVGKTVSPRNTVENSTDVTDDMGHGTFVAGVAAAATGNAKGIAGVGWNARIMPVKVADDYGLMTDLDVAEGIRWAADHGAEIINLSLGSTYPDDVGRSAVAYARAKGCLVVAAAGNSAQDGNPKMYPAAFPGVVAVGATRDATHRAWFSEHGSWVTLAAPGMSIRGTTPVAGSQMFAANYSDGDGTSFSTPIVAGAAALLWARTAGPSASKVRNALVTTARGFAGMGLGAGEIRVGAAVQTVVPDATPSISLPVDGSTHTGRTVPLRAGVSAGRSRIAWYVDGTRVAVSGNGTSTSWEAAGSGQSTHTVQARVCSWTLSCAKSGPSVQITVDRPDPVISSPSGGARVTGAVRIATSTTGMRAVAAVVDGKRVAVDSSAPLAPEVNFSALADGTHSVRLVECNAAGTRCGGARSAAVTVTSASLHPRLRVVRNRHFSPDGDRVQDATTLRYTLDARQRVTLRFVRGSRTERVVRLGIRKAGRYTYTWKGTHADGSAAPHGGYTVRLDSTAGGRTGRAAAIVVLDRRSPSFTRSRPATAFYPVRDGYRDTWRLALSVAESATATVTIRDATGHVVRRLSASHTARGGARARIAVTWNGKNSSGNLVRAGRYRWSLTVRDLAGKRAGTGSFPVRVFRSRVTSRTVTLTTAGTTAFRTGGTASCATTSRTRSGFPRGLWLRNDCSRSTSQQVLAWYAFRLPAGVSHTRIRLLTSGRSHSAPVDVIGAVWSHHTGDYDYTSLHSVTSRTTKSLALGSFAAAGHSDDRWVQAVVYVPNTRRPLTDWDLRDVRLAVTYDALG